MVKLLIGSVAGGIAMFIAGFIFWASPLARIGMSQASDMQNAVIQRTLAANLPHTGYYTVPDPNSSGGTVLYGKGPVASVNYNSGGFSTSDTAGMIGGFVQEVVASFMIGLTLLAVAGRVTDFPSRARLAIGLSAAATMMITISEPIWMHGDWRYAVYALVADLAMLSASGLVIARWFLPRA